MIITPIQIRFNDMDPMGRVNNATYSSYLELGRLDFCNKYIAIRELNDIPFVLVRIEMDIKRSLRPLHKAEVRTWVSRIGETSWDFNYSIIDSDSQQVEYVHAKSVQVFYNYRLDRKEPIPESFRSFLVAEFQD
ncbi:acyl-CoA thioesterase [Leptospira sp. GIMC2001]|uniref:acyl-CoA thioesterase n=1 Tax=Leptospira sp. GIMC2001 TaxID=1513297 RepID=UPI00234A7629|nr:acyl-CoA thioesterase [Leptospira sp. GIMC2001]WCL50081.1 acyl-CoA thioesterase [Leptospira sp. GIMC2001]